MANHEEVDVAKLWEARYTDSKTPWDLGGPSPPFVTLLSRKDLLDEPLGRPGPFDVAIPGCGRGYDVVRWAEAGHRVTGFDFAPSALAAGRALANAAGVSELADFQDRDLFDLPTTHKDRFDVVLEYTCFCAIHPSRRAEYAAVIASILRPGGLLIGLFYPNQAGETGPPYPVRPEHTEQFLHGPGGPFDLLHESLPTNSIPRRKGRERLLVLRAR
ncbi:MAG: methyltransferase domain-containing protein [Planctomycetota bacterium]|jgi:SAM-dependent methyltransferase